MPTFKITAPDGRTVRLTGDSPPSETELEEVFSKLPARVAPAASTPLRRVDAQIAAAGGTGAQKEPEGSAAGRFVGNAWHMANPVAAVRGAYNAAIHPIGTLEGQRQESTDQFSKLYNTMRDALHKSRELHQNGRELDAWKTVVAALPAAMGHEAAALVPFLGPAAAHAGEKIAQGDIAGGLGEGAGLLIAPKVAETALSPLRSAASAAARVTTPEALEAGAAARVADVMSPKVGANKVRFGGMAERVAPAIVRDLADSGAPLTREGLQTHVQGRLAEAEQALDAASEQRLKTRTYATKDILADLQAKRDALTAKAVGRGEDVVPQHNAGRVAEIDQAMREVKKLGGPFVTYDAIRNIRQSYDGPAKAVYNSAVTPDFMKAKGAQLGAADVAGTLRDHLAKWDPQTAAANAKYSVYRTANDVLDATAEVERTRPKVGRQIAARLSGTVIGAESGGPVGAVAGFALGPAIDAAVSSGATTSLKTAAAMQKLADAIRRGDVGRVHSITHQLGRMALPAEAAGRTDASRGPTMPRAAENDDARDERMASR